MMLCHKKREVRRVVVLLRFVIAGGSIKYIESESELSTAAVIYTTSKND